MARRSRLADSLWPRRVSVADLTLLCELVSIDELRTLADRWLTRAAVAKIVLEHRDPEAAARWQERLRRAAQLRLDDLEQLDALDSTVPLTRPRSKPS